MVGQCQCQPFPNDYNKIFRGRLQSFRNKWHIEVQIAVIQVIGYFGFDDLAQVFGINDEAREGIGRALHRYMEGIVVAVPVFVGAFPEYLEVFFFGPGGYPQFMGGVKSFYSC